MDFMLKSKALFWYRRVPVIKDPIRNVAGNKDTQEMCNQSSNVQSVLNLSHRIR
jgi:hypothetical protein